MINVKRLVIDSDDLARQNPANLPHDFQINIPEDAGGPFQYIALKSFVAFKSWYNIAAPSNSFEASADSFTWLPITVPPGSYNFLSLRAALVAAMVGAFPTVAITYDQTSALLTISASNLWGLRFVSSRGSEFINTMFRRLGFLPDSTAVATAGTVVSPRPINLQNIPALLVHSDIVTPIDTAAASDTFEIISAAGFTQYGPITYEAPDIYGARHTLRTDRGVGTYRFYITDPDGQMVDFRGQPINWVFILWRDPKPTPAPIMPPLGGFVQPIPMPPARVYMPQWRPQEAAAGDFVDIDADENPD